MINYLEVALQTAQAGNHSNLNHLAYCIGKEQMAIINAVMDKKIWFIDIPRTSSSSIQLMLGQKFGFPFGKREVPGKGIILGTSSELIPPHTLAVNVRNLLGPENWSALQSFSIVRDPYTWALSFWKYNRDYVSLGLKTDTFSIFLKNFSEHCSGPKEVRRFYPTSYIQSDYISDEKDNVIVSNVLKFEDRDSINEYLIGLGVEEITDEKFVASKGEAYQMSNEEKQLVRKVFEKDFDILGY